MAEIWIYDGTSLVIQQLENGSYITAATSQFSLSLPIADVAGFLQQASTTDYLELIRIFRRWVKN